ncbi:Cyclic nucleotide-gated cation channel subunit A (Cyclic nucleotide-gated ion channel subunit A) (CNG channel) [Durusdinium trenchii]
MCSCAPTGPTPVGGATPGGDGSGASYESFVTAQLEILRQNLLQHYETEMRGLSKPFLRSATEGESIGVANLEVCGDGAEEEEEEEEPVPFRWLELTARVLEASEAEVEEAFGGWALEELRMRPVWSISLQDLRRRSRPRNFRTKLTNEIITMKMNAPMREAATVLQGLVLKPNSWQQLLWTTIGALLILWDLITIPLGFFNLPQFLDFLTIFARVSFAYWIIDMPLHVIFGTEINGAQELRPKKLLKMYLRSWFLIDLMIISIDAVIIILEVFQETSDEFSMWRSARFFRALRLLRLLRLLRVTKLQQEVMVVANRFLSTNAFLVLKIGGGIFMMLITNHIIACCWFGVGTFGREDGHGWLVNFQMNENTDFPESYAAALHWSLTQFTPATNNIAPDNVTERIFAVVVILVAVIIFSSFIASISSTLNALRVSRVAHSKQYMNLFQFFNERNLSVNLYGKVKEVLRTENLTMRIQEKEVGLLDKIPERLKMQLHNEIYMPFLLSLKIWPRGDIDDIQYIYSNVCHRAMVEGYASPGQDVFMPGTDCRDVYILESGRMLYLARQEHNDEEAPFVVLQQENLCVACLWTEWHHRGRLSAGQGIGYYIQVQCDAFGHLVVKFGGPLWRFLQIFGILLVSELEFLQDMGEPVSDLGLPEDRMSDLATRAERFEQVLVPSGSPRGASVRPDGLSRIISITSSKTKSTSAERFSEERL